MGHHYMVKAFHSNGNVDTIQVGFLTYDLQPFTEDCLYRIACAIEPFTLKAYPIIFHPHQEKARVSRVATLQKGKYFSVNAAGSTPEGFSSNINWLAAWRCAKESDVIVLFGLLGGTALLTALLAALRGRSLISVNQALPIGFESKRRWWIRLLKQWLLNRCDFHIYQTEITKEVLIKSYCIDEELLFYAPFEAGVSWFKGILAQQRGMRDIARSELGVSDDDVVFLFVGNLHPFKGIPDLIKAAACMPKDARFVCVFAGPEERRNKVGGTIDYYMVMARDLQIEQRLRFLGNLSPDRLASVFLASDVVVLPTHKDCFPKILAEGALTSKPLITTNACGAVGSLVFDGDNGFVIQPGDIQSLSDAMTRLLDSKLREKMGAKSKALVERLCDKEAETRGFLMTIKAAFKARQSR